MATKKHAPSVPKAVPAPEVVIEAAPAPAPVAKGIVYAVTLQGENGRETVEVRAESGDEAAAKASKTDRQVVGVVPA